MAINGWIKLHRCIWDCELWIDETPFDDRSAWIDLLLVCTRSARRVRFGKEIIELVPGEYVTSQSRLANRWHWSRKKVSNYLKVLDKLGQITTRKAGLWLVITVVKYNEYQGPTEEQVKDGLGTGSERVEHRLSTGVAQARNSSGTTKQEYKEYKEDREGISANLVSTVEQQRSCPQAVDISDEERAVKNCGSFYFPGLNSVMADKIRACVADVGYETWAEALERSKGVAKSPAYVIKVAYGLHDGVDFKRAKKNDVEAVYDAAMKGDWGDEIF